MRRVRNSWGYKRLVRTRRGRHFKWTRLTKRNMRRHYR